MFLLILHNRGRVRTSDRKEEFCHRHGKLAEKTELMQKVVEANLTQLNATSLGLRDN